MKVNTKEELADIINGSPNDADLNHLDVSGINDMSYLFDNTYFNGKIDKWDTSNVENMHAMFCGSYFNQPIENWNVSKVKDMGFMFMDSKFNQSIQNWDTSNVENMHAMFLGSSFNQDISNLDVGNLIRGKDYIQQFIKVESPTNPKTAIKDMEIDKLMTAEEFCKKVGVDHSNTLYMRIYAQHVADVLASECMRNGLHDVMDILKAVHEKIDGMCRVAECPGSSVIETQCVEQALKKTAPLLIPDSELEDQINYWIGHYRKYGDSHDTYAQDDRIRQVYWDKIVEMVIQYADIEMTEEEIEMFQERLSNL